MTKPNLLFITPTEPKLTGYGPAMRAGMVLEALSKYYRVYLLMVPIIGEKNPPEPPEPIASWCTEVKVYPVREREDPRRNNLPGPNLFRFGTPGAIAGVHRLFQEIDFQAVHVFRLYTAPFAEPYFTGSIQNRPRRLLDLDDFDSRGFRRIAKLYEATGNHDLARWRRSEARRFAVMEARYLPRFDQVYVASEVDRQAVAKRYELHNITVLPNAVRIPDCRASSTHKRKFTFLFVGVMNYYPNEDAVLYFCREVLPALRKIAPKPFHVMIVGKQPPAQVYKYAGKEEVTLTGPVPDPAPYYQRANAFIVPIRAGAGTRIKILEAASYQCPIVATRVGIEGLDVTHGKELLVAGGVAEFARHCALLMEDRVLARDLAERAFRWVKRHHTLNQVKDVIRNTALPAGGDDR